MSTLTRKTIKKSPSKPAALKSPQRFLVRDSALTIDEWAAMPDTKPRYELVNGKLIQKMPTTLGHAFAAAELLFAFMGWGRTTGWKFIPEGTGIKVDEFNGTVPDLLGFSPDQKLESQVVYHRETPFLIVEILSPKTARADRTRKKENYATIGARLYLIVDPIKQTLEIFRLKNNQYGDSQLLGKKDIWQPEEMLGLKLELKNLWMS